MAPPPPLVTPPMMLPPPSLKTPAMLPNQIFSPAKPTALLPPGSATKSDTPPDGGSSNEELPPRPPALPPKFDLPTDLPPLPPPPPTDLPPLPDSIGSYEDTDALPPPPIEPDSPEFRRPRAATMPANFGTPPRDSTLLAAFASPLPPPLPAKSSSRSPPQTPRTPTSLSPIVSPVMSRSSSLTTPPTPPRADRTKLWANFHVSVRGSAPPPKDYLADVPPNVAEAARFAEQLLKGRNYTDCYDLFADSLQEVIAPDQLEALTDYYGRLDGLWYCQAVSFSAVGQYWVVYIPLFSHTENHQLKLWVDVNAPGPILGLEFAALNEQGWAETAGQMERWTIAPPKVIVFGDGTRKEVRSAEEEIRILAHPELPVGLCVGNERVFHCRLSHQIQVKQKKATLPRRKDKDGKSYIVFGDSNLTEATRRAFPRAYCKEFWMAEKDDPQPFCHLLDHQGDRLSDERYLELADGSLETREGYRKAKPKPELSKRALPQLNNLVVALPIPPELPCQSMSIASLRAVPDAGMISVDQNAYLIFVEEKKCAVSATMEVHTRSCILKPLYEGESYLEDSTNMLPRERAAELCATPELDFFAMREWINHYALIKNIYNNDENDIRFARRAFIHVAQETLFTYPASDQRASQVARSGKGDSVGISRLYVALLRANGIPARVLFGRRAESKQKGETVKWLDGDSGADNDMLYATAQFYVDGIGWIPADVSQSVRNLNPHWDRNRPETLLFGFARDTGDFIALSHCPLVELPHLGPTFIGQQGFTFFFDHKKVSNDWNVTLM
eukprot:TRINITY_DN4603_c0_g1_i2.p1 TRINITY_DN4603_c0_g1~~TRINITY_DN4603_c0_g1_i2.p1  ORF type:complete len:787 (-),score=231.82 TRINITY_DN4603_c0_g1_i2:130-2490(-)